MIDAAIRAGAHCVKFQSWSEDTLVSHQEYNRNTDYGDDPINQLRHFGSLEDMVKAYQFSDAQHTEIAAYCKEKGIHFASSAFSEHEADLLASLDVPFIKIASMDVNYHRLLKYVAGKGLPVIMSTGMASLAEIDEALKVMADAGAGRDKVIVLHCRSTYPPKDNDNDLLHIPMLRETFGYSTGFSDHSLGYVACIAGAAYGATVLEKHFTTDKDMPGWDHWMSADEAEMKAIVDGSRQASDFMGQWELRVTDDEMAKMDKFRRCIVVTRDIKAGEVIGEKDINFKRPGTGIRPDEEQYVVGRLAKVDITAEHELSWDMLV